MSVSRHAARPAFFRAALAALALAVAWAIPARAAAADGLTDALRVALELSAEGDHHGAAVEFRRLALSAPDAAARGACFWSAGHEYWKDGGHGPAAAMLDRAEDADPSLRAPALLLRAENAASERAYDEAAFYFDDWLRMERDPAARSYAARRLACVRLRQGRPDDAREALRGEPDAAAARIEAVDAWERGPRRSPRVGGLLGLIPGLGYGYSGEWANAARSAILNGLFIYGLVATADDEQWGAFTAIAFFELTWYSGSVYGGLDAAHRFNARRLDEACDAILGGAAFEPDFTALPVLRLRYVF
jgi:hypothetical protein